MVILIEKAAKEEAQHTAEATTEEHLRRGIELSAKHNETQLNTTSVPSESAWLQAHRIVGTSPQGPLFGYPTPDGTPYETHPSIHPMLGPSFPQPCTPAAGRHKLCQVRLSCVSPVRAILVLW